MLHQGRDRGGREPPRQHLAAAKFTVVTAESWIASQLVSLLATLPAAAVTLESRFIAYSKRSKTAAPGVPRTIIARHTSVSREVAMAMAKGALKRTRAHIATAIIGVAGPRRDEDGNPVGLVYIAATRRNSLCPPTSRKQTIRATVSDFS